MVELSACRDGRPINAERTTMSDDATGGARQGACASPGFHRALDLSKPRRVVTIDLAGAKCWLGPRWGHLYQAALFRLLDKCWYHTRITLDGYQAPPGCSRGVKFMQLSVEQALLLCTDEGIDPPRELIEEYKSFADAGPGPQASRSDPGEGAGNLPSRPKEKRRGRVAGVNKIENAKTELRSRLADGRPTTLEAIAKAVGYRDAKTLKRSHGFMDFYRTLVDGATRAARFEGSKTDGNLEARPKGVLHRSKSDCDPRHWDKGYTYPPDDIDDDEKGFSE